MRACLHEAETGGLLAPDLHAEEAAVVVLGALLALAHTIAPPAAMIPAIAPRAWSALESFLRGPAARQLGAEARPPRAPGRKHTRRRS